MWDTKQTIRKCLTLTRKQKEITQMWLQLVFKLFSKMLQVLVCQSGKPDTMTIIMVNYAQPCTYLQQPAGISFTSGQSFIWDASFSAGSLFTQWLWTYHVFRWRWFQLFVAPSATALAVMFFRRSQKEISYFTVRWPKMYYCVFMCWGYTVSASSCISDFWQNKKPKKVLTYSRSFLTDCEQLIS